MRMDGTWISTCFLPCFKGTINENDTPVLMRNSNDTPTNSEHESVRLVKAFLAGDKKAFDELILLQKRMVFNLSFRFLVRGSNERHLDFSIYY